MTGFGLRISGVGTNRAKTIARAIERNICFYFNKTVMFLNWA